MNIDNSKGRELELKPEEETETSRLSISKIASQALGLIIERVNNGFEGGKVNRSQIANWLIIRTNDDLSEEIVKEIRAQHIDEFAVFDAVLRRAKESGQLPAELRAFIQKHAGIDDSPKKKFKKALPTDVINDDIGK